MSTRPIRLPDSALDEIADFCEAKMMFSPHDGVSITKITELFAAWRPKSRNGDYLPDYFGTVLRCLDGGRFVRGFTICGEAQSLVKHGDTSVPKAVTDGLIWLPDPSNLCRLINAQMGPEGKYAIIDRSERNRCLGNKVYWDDPRDFASKNTPLNPLTGKRQTVVVWKPRIEDRNSPKSKTKNPFLHQFLLGSEFRWSPKDGNFGNATRDNMQNKGKNTPPKKKGIKLTKNTPIEVCSGGTLTIKLSSAAQMSFSPS